MSNDGSRLDEDIKAAAFLPRKIDELVLVPWSENQCEWSVLTYIPHILERVLGNFQTPQLAVSGVG
jgi:hypothetical protein